MSTPLRGTQKSHPFSVEKTHETATVIDRVNSAEKHGHIDIQDQQEEFNAINSAASVERASQNLESALK